MYSETPLEFFLDSKSTHLLYQPINQKLKKRNKLPKPSTCFLHCICKNVFPLRLLIRCLTCSLGANIFSYTIKWKHSKKFKSIFLVYSFMILSFISDTFSLYSMHNEALRIPLMISGLNRVLSESECTFWLWFWIPINFYLTDDMHFNYYRN